MYRQCRTFRNLGALASVTHRKDLEKSFLPGKPFPSRLPRGMTGCRHPRTCRLPCWFPACRHQLPGFRRSRPGLLQGSPRLHAQGHEPLLAVEGETEPPPLPWTGKPRCTDRKPGGIMIPARLSFSCIASIWLSFSAIWR